MSWSDERVAALRKLWSDGLSAAQIAMELGDVTRNAVIGKVHRLGLSGRGMPATFIRPQRRTYSSKRARAVASVVRKGRTADKREATTARRQPVVKPIPLRLTLFQLTSRTCKWPIGDPLQADFCFCGHDAVDELPYCEYHAGIAYEAPSPRKPGHLSAFGSMRSGAWA